MTKIDKSIEVRTSRDELFELLTNLELLTHWSTITAESHGTPRKPIQKGDTFTQRKPASLPARPWRPLLRAGWRSTRGVVRSALLHTGRQGLRR